MRCDDLIRELASPTGALSPAAMAGHLADCPACARWSNQAARFDQIWEATRPAEPTSAELDALWAKASVALEARPAATAPLRLVPRQHWLKPTLILAQAAAILVAAGFYWQRSIRVEPTQVAQVEVKNPLEVILEPVPETPAPQIAQGVPAQDRDTDVIPTFHVNDDETLLVSIPMNKTDEPKVNRLKQPWPEKSNLIPPIMPHDVIGAVEIMTGKMVFTSL